MVVHDIPPRSVAVAIPARVIKVGAAAEDLAEFTGVDKAKLNSVQASGPAGKPVSFQEAGLPHSGRAHTSSPGY